MLVGLFDAPVICTTSGPSRSRAICLPPQDPGAARANVARMFRSANRGIRLSTASGAHRPSHPPCGDRAPPFHRLIRASPAGRARAAAPRDCRPTPLRSIATSTVGSSTPGALPPPIADDPITSVTFQPAASSRSASARARASMASASNAIIRITGTVCAARPAKIFEKRALERGQRQLVDAQRAHQWMRAQHDRRAPTSEMMPACGPPNSLSPLKHTRSAPAAIDDWTLGSQSIERSRYPLPRSSTSGI